MAIPSENSWRFVLKRTDQGGSSLKYNSTLKNTSDATAVPGTAPQSAYTKLVLISAAKNLVRSV